MSADRGSPVVTVFSSGSEAVQQRLADRLLDDHPLDADARLAGGVEPAAYDRFRGPVEVGVAADDERRVGPEFQQHLARGRGAGDLVADLRGPGERHGGDARVGGQELADLDAAGDELDAGGRAARPAEQVDQHQRGQRRVRRRLDDHRAARRHRRRDLVRGQEQRVVEPGDADDDTDRAAYPEAEHALAGRLHVQCHRLAGEVADLLGRRLQRDQRAGDLDPAVDKRLAGLQDQQLGEVVGAGADLGGDCREDGAPPVTGQAGHLRGDLVRGLDSRFRVGGVTPGRLGHGAAVVREAHRRGLRGGGPAGADRQSGGQRGQQLLRGHDASPARAPVAPVRKASAASA